MCYLILQLKQQQNNRYKISCPVVTLSTQDNAKLLQQLKASLERTSNWNIYQSKGTIQGRNQHLDELIDPIFQGIKRLFVLSLENNTDRTAHIKYYLSTVEIEEHNVIIFGNLFDKPLKNTLKTYDNIPTSPTSQKDDYTTGCLLDTIKQQTFDVDPQAIQEITISGGKCKYNNILHY